jgi:hypothetical protein
MRSALNFATRRPYIPLSEAQTLHHTPAGGPVAYGRPHDGTADSNIPCVRCGGDDDCKWFKSLVVLYSLPVWRSWDRAMRSWAGVKGFFKRMLFGTP